MSGAGLTIMIGSFLAEEQVRRIAAAPEAGQVSYEPGLLPVPRYPCDHNLSRLAAGEPLRNRYDPARGY
jgi:hypothetical protein